MTAPSAFAARPRGRLCPTDLVSLVNLTYAVSRDRPDPASRATAMLARLVHLLGADGAAALPVRAGESAHPLAIAGRWMAEDTRTLLATLAERKRVSHASHRRDAAPQCLRIARVTPSGGASFYLYSRPAAGPERIATLAFKRAGTAFDRAEVQIVRAMHASDVARDLLHASAFAGEVPPLPTRASEVLERLRDGLTEKQVAVGLGLSPHTVHVHVKRIYRHFGVSSRAELLSLWVPRQELNGGRCGVTRTRRSGPGGARA